MKRVVRALVSGLCVLGIVGIVNAGGVTAKATLDNLHKAYKQEQVNKTTYGAFAVKADEEGFKSVAGLFRALARSEGMRLEKHAGMIKELGGKADATQETVVKIKTTKENLETALKMETTDKEAMYKRFAEQATTDKQAHAAMSFNGAVAIGASNAKMIEQATKELDAWKAAGKEFLVCEVCTYVTMDLKIEKCPICAAPRSKFEVVK